MHRAWVEPLAMATAVMLVVVVVASLHLTGSHDVRPAATRLEWGSQAFAGDDSFADAALPQVAAATPDVGPQPATVATAPTPAPQQLAPASTESPSPEEVQALAQQRQADLAKLRQQAEQRAAQLNRQAEVQRQPISIKMAVFNILGSNHTGRGSGYASGRTRAGWAVGLLDDFDFVALSEVQSDQLAVLAGAMGNAYDFYPGTALGNAAVPTNVMWRSDRFGMVEGGTVSIPFVGQTRLMPYVRLRDKATNKEFWVLNAHNAPQGRQSERNAAVAIEIAKLKELVATGLPVFFMGDLNEKDTVFCKVTGALPMGAANGGSTGGGCSLPPAAKIDWIFGTTSHVQFSGYSQVEGGLISRITDHHLISATATVK